MVKHPEILALATIGLMLWAGYEWRAFYRLGRHGRRHRRTGQLWKQDQRQRFVHAYYGLLLTGMVGTCACLLLANDNSDTDPTFPTLAAGGGFGCLAVGFMAAIPIRTYLFYKQGRKKLLISDIFGSFLIGTVGLFLADHNNTSLIYLSFFILTLGFEMAIVLLYLRFGKR